MKYPLVFFAWLMFCIANSAFAAQPTGVQASYDVYKGSIKIGKITETYKRDKDRYTLTSTMSPVGLLAVFKPGKIILSSSGLVGTQGLQPLHFNDLREGDESRNRSAEFDWNAKQLTLNNRDQRSVFLLPDDTQDRLSAMYQFMFLSLASTLNFHMTNGGKLDIYNYLITPGQSVTVPFGTLKSIYMSTTPQVTAWKTEIWLSVENNNLPCKVILTDDDGDKLLQVLTALSITR